MTGRRKAFRPTETKCCICGMALLWETMSTIFWGLKLPSMSLPKSKPAMFVPAKAMREGERGWARVRRLGARLKMKMLGRWENMIVEL